MDPEHHDLLFLVGGALLVSIFAFVFHWFVGRSLAIFLGVSLFLFCGMGMYFGNKIPFQSPRSFMAYSHSFLVPSVIEKVGVPEQYEESYDDYSIEIHPARKVIRFQKDNDHELILFQGWFYYQISLYKYINQRKESEVTFFQALMTNQFDILVSFFNQHGVKLTETEFKY